MSIRVECAQCAKQFSAPDQSAGRQTACPNCGCPLRIPNAAESFSEISAGFDLAAEPSSTGQRGQEQPSWCGPAGGSLSGKNDLRHRVKAWIYKHGPARYIATHRLRTAVLAIGFLWLVEAVGTSRTGVSLLAALAAALVVGIDALGRSTPAEKALVRIFAIIATVSLIVTGIAMAIGAWHAGKDSASRLSAFLMWLVVFAVILVAAFLLLALLCFVLRRAGFFQVLAWSYVVSFGLFPLCSIPVPVVEGRGALSSMQAANSSLAKSLAELCGPTVRRPCGKPSGPRPSPHEKSEAAKGIAGPSAPVSEGAVDGKTETASGQVAEAPRDETTSAPKQVAKARGETTSPSWTARPDPLPAEEATARGPIVLHCGLGSIGQVVFCPEATRVAVMSSQTSLAGRQPAATPCRIDVYDLNSGDHLRRCGLPERSVLADVSADGERALVLRAGQAEVWSLETTDRQQWWDFAGATQGGDEWAAFLDAKEALTLSPAGRLTLWKLPEQKEVYTIENVRGANVSPGRKYVVTIESQTASTTVRVREASTGKCCGDLRPPGDPRSRPGPVSVAFCADGSRVAVAGREDVVLWSTAEGKPLWELSLRMPEQPPLFLGSDYLLTGPLGDDCELVDIKRGAVVWHYGFRLSRVRWNGMIHRNLTGKFWLLAAAEDESKTYLTTLGIPGARVQAELSSIPTTPLPQPGVTEIADEEFVGGGMPGELPKEEFPETLGKGQLSAAGFGISSIADWGTQRAQEAASLAYVTKTYSDLLAGDDATLQDRLRWFPAAGRPTVGLRFGLGVQVIGQDEQPKVDSRADLAKLTGPIAPYLGMRLFQRVTNREFGYWPDRGLSDLQQVALLGGGKHKDLLAAARRQGLDVMIVATLTPRSKTPGSKGGALLQFRITDVSDGKHLWSWPPTDNKIQVKTAARTDASVDAEVAAEILRYVDGHFRLQPMPELTDSFVQCRLAELSEIVDDARANRQTLNLLAAMVEMRYYFLKHLVPQDDVVRLYDVILGNGKGKALAVGDESHRHQVLEDWLTRTL